MTRPNLIISSRLFSDTGAAPILDTSALDSFVPSFADEIDALNTPGNPTSAALDADPTSLRSNEVIWGNTTNGAILTGSGLTQISNLAQFESDLANGIATGAFDTLRIFSGGQNILSLSFAPNALTLSSGTQSLALRGVLPTSFQDIFNFITQLGNVADGIDLAAAAQILRDFDLEGLRITDGGLTLFDLTLDNSGLRITTAGAEFRIDGTLPANNLGDIVDLLSELNGFDQTAAGLSSLAQLPGVAITDISLTDASGARLIRLSGPVAELDPLFANVVIEGTPGNDRDILVSDLGFGVNGIVLQLGAGNDSASLVGSRFGVEDANGAPVVINAGAGFDTVTITDFYSAIVAVDFSAQSLSGRQLVDQFNYDVRIVDVEEVLINTFQRAVLLGDGAANTATPGAVFGLFEFYGGGGTDILNLTQVRHPGTGEIGLSLSDLAGFTATYGGNNAIAFTHSDLAVTFVLGDVERVRLTDREITLTEALSQSSDIVRFTIGTSGNDSLKGDLGADVILGQSGSDYLYGDGIQANLTGAVAGQVYRMYQATLDRAPDAVGYEGWVTQLYEGRVALANFPNGFVNSGEFQRSYGGLDNAGFVELLYQNVLDRASDAGGRQGWLDAMASGTSRAGVVLGFSESAEFKRDTAAASASFALSQSEAHWTDDVYRVYRATLDRDPDMVGFGGWIELLGSGTGYQTMIGGFTNSREFKTTYGALDDAGFVELLYQNVLDRASDAGGRQGWLDFLDAGGTRAGVVEGFAQSGEFRLDTAADLTAWVKAQGTHDDIYAGAGGNTLMGGILQDRFVFEAGQPGGNTIADFEVWDSLRMNGFGYGDYGAFASHLTQSGADLVFADQGTTITLANTLMADLSADQVDLF
jgi:hypothetical protein